MDIEAFSPSLCRRRQKITQPIIESLVTAMSVGVPVPEPQAPTQYGAMIIGVCNAFIAVSGIAVALRFAAIRIQKRTIQSHDWMIIAALVRPKYSLSKFEH